MQLTSINCQLGTRKRLLLIIAPITGLTCKPEKNGGISILQGEKRLGLKRYVWKNLKRGLETQSLESGDRPPSLSIRYSIGWQVQIIFLYP